MLDFTSALYLGLTHDSQSLPRWRALTTGVPAALRSAPGASRVAAGLARVIGTERATLSPSTLHLFWDLFAVLARRPIAIHFDDGLYPIAEWGIERVRAAGVLAISFPHHDPDWLRWQLTRFREADRQPVVVTDGFCPGCGRQAPLGDYLEIVRHQGGILVIDDTQALGLLGADPGGEQPFGRGGGGSLAAMRLQGPDIFVGASLAKALGVPLAVGAGGEALVHRLEAYGETRVHCSGPSAAALAAAERALAINAADGDALRGRLARRIRHFRDGLARIGLHAIGGLFPVQRLGGHARMSPLWLHHQLEQAGVRTVLHRTRCDEAGASIGFLVTARHTVRELDGATEVLRATLETKEPPPPLAEIAMLET